MLSGEEKQIIIDTIKAATKECDLESKFVIEKLKTGKPTDAALGLKSRMNVEGDAVFNQNYSNEIEGIEAEVNQFISKYSDKDSNCFEVGELCRYVIHEKCSPKQYPNGIRDEGRDGKNLSHFLTHRSVQDAKLKPWEVVALRLYTTSVYKYMNNPLRDDSLRGRDEKCPLAVTTQFAVEGIKKLRALHKAEGEENRQIVLWRGMRNIETTEEFLKEGGTELAFMSTTSNLEVAVKYSMSRRSLLLKIVAENFMSAGAPLKFLSAFPSEEEFLYPPLTYLHPTGRAEDIHAERSDGEQVLVTVIEVTPFMA